MRLWIDDVRPAPKGYLWVKSVYEAKVHCCQHLSPEKVLCIREINLDHDSGDFFYLGGDYIELLNWLEEKQHINDWYIPTKFYIHSMNPVGVQNMRTIIQKNGWTEI